jgi:hypothetical protein
MFRRMKFPDKTLKFNFNHSPKAINNLITQSACAYLDLLPRVKRMLTEIYAGNQYFICMTNYCLYFLKNLNNQLIYLV